jgi:PKD repeat protein
MRKRLELSGLWGVRLAGLVILLLLLVPLTACQLFNAPPRAVIAATPESGEAPLTVSFDLSGSSDPDGQIVSFELYFGDCTLPLAGTELTRPVQHTYQRAGTFQAALRVKDDAGATDEATATVTLGGPSPIGVLKVGGGSVKAGESLEVPIILDSAPQGLAGYIMTVFLMSRAVADIEGVTLVSLREAGAVNLAPDKKSVTFQAVDFSGAIRPGSSDITLARVSFKALKKGTSIICSQVDRLDADGGADLRPLTKVDEGNLTVTP